MLNITPIDYRIIGISAKTSYQASVDKFKEVINELKTNREESEVLR